MSELKTKAKGTSKVQVERAEKKRDAFSRLRQSEYCPCARL